MSEFFLNLIPYLTEHMNEINIIYLAIIIIAFSLILYSLPIPGTFILIFHIIFFGLYGFLTAYFCANISAILLYFLFNKYVKFKNIHKFIFLKQYIENIYVLTLARIFIPFPICTYVFIILKINYKRFIIATLLGTVPGTLSVSLLLNSIKNNFLDNNNFIFSTLNDPIFFLAIFMVIVFLLLSSYFNKKFKNK